MAQSENRIRDSVVVIVVWLIAIALVYLVFLKIRLLFADVMNY
jgi:hypothetical protein